MVGGEVCHSRQVWYSWLSPCANDNLIFAISKSDILTSDPTFLIAQPNELSGRRVMLESKICWVLQAVSPHRAAVASSLSTVSILETPEWVSKIPPSLLALRA